MANPIFDDFKSDLQEARQSCLLIDIPNQTLRKIFDNDASDQLIVECSKVFDVDAEGKRLASSESNMIVIDCSLGEHAQLLSRVFALLPNVFEERLMKDALVNVLSYAMGGFLSNTISTSLGDLFAAGIEEASKNIENFEEWITGISDKANEKASSILGGTAAEATWQAAVSADNHLSHSDTPLFLSSKAKQELGQLVDDISSDQSSHEVMKYTLKLLKTLALGAPKLILIKNPNKLDDESVALLSLLLSDVKDMKQRNANSDAFSGLSIILVDDAQVESDDTQVESPSENIRLLCGFAQRYGILERAGSSRPIPAVRSTTFVGRRDELDQLQTDNNRLLNTLSEDDSTHCFFSIIKGEPGVGKTALIHHHIKDTQSNNTLATDAHISLSILNQVGHSSKVTGLASLQDSIDGEIQRLILAHRNRYKIFSSSIDSMREWQHEKKIKLEAIFSDINDWREKINSSFGLISEVAKDVGTSITGTKPIIGASKNIYDRTNIIASRNQSISAAASNVLTNAEQFKILLNGIDYIKRLSSEIRKSSTWHIQLFIDDLQWIDETCAEFLVTKLFPNYSAHVLCSVRDSDGIAVHKAMSKNRSDNKYRLAFFDLCSISSDDSPLKSGEEVIENFLSSNKSNVNLLSLNGLDEATLSALIIENYSAHSEKEIIIAKAIAKKIIHFINPGSPHIVTLFAIETLNLISDPSFYTESNQPPLFVEERRGIYRLATTKEIDTGKNLQMVFDSLSQTYNHTYEKELSTGANYQYFSLSSYAVLSERVSKIRSYFDDDGESGDATVFALQLATLLGVPFDSAIVNSLLFEFEQMDTETYPLLKPIKDFLSNSHGIGLNNEHLEVLEEAFQLLVRLNQMGANYKYHHNLHEVFYDKQLYAFLAEKLDDEQALKEFFNFCWQHIVNIFAENPPQSNTINKFDFFPHILNKAKTVLSKASYRGFLCKCYTDSILPNVENFKENALWETEKFITSVTRNDGGVVHSFLKNPECFIDLLTITRHISPDTYKAHCETLLRDIHDSEQCIDIARNRFLFIDHPTISLNLLLWLHLTGENLTNRDAALAHYSVCYQREVYRKLNSWKFTYPGDTVPSLEVFMQGLVEDTTLFKFNLIDGFETFKDMFVANVSRPLGYTEDFIDAFRRVVETRHKFHENDELSNLIDEENRLANDLNSKLNIDVKDYPVVKAYDLCGDVFFPELGVESGYKDHTF